MEGILCTGKMPLNCIVPTDAQEEAGMELLMLWFPEEEESLRQHKDEIMKAVMTGEDPPSSSGVFREQRVDAGVSGAAFGQVAFRPGRLLQAAQCKNTC